MEHHVTWTPNLRRGVDLPLWDYLAFIPAGNSNPGAGNAFDGRNIYFAVQVGTSTAGSASTSQLWKYDTVREGWAFLASLTTGNQGMDVEYDAVRNLVIVTNGNAQTSWQVFNLNTTAVTFANQSIPAWTITTVTTVLPAAAGVSSSLCMPDDTTVSTTTTNPQATDTGVTTAASSTTSIVDSGTGKPNSGTGTFGQGMVGLQVRLTSGALSGQARIISAVVDPKTLTTAAFTLAPSAGVTFVVEAPQGAVTAGSTTTVTDAVASWPTNHYASSDVVIMSGTGAGQRRRITSNTATTLTLAAAVAGNARTGAFTTAPDATSVYRIVPSSDFLYYQPGVTSNTIYRLDVVQTTGSAWTASLATAPAAPGGGGNLMFPQQYSPFSLIQLRGNTSASYYHFWVGPLTYTTPTVFAGAESFATGASAALVHGRRKIFIAQNANQRTLYLDLTTGLYEPGPFTPYAAGTSGSDGHRSRYVKTPDGVEYMYHLRAGGQEWFRVPLEDLVA